jgi:hypothetical protein
MSIIFLSKELLWASTTKYVYIKSTTVYVSSSELGLSHPLSHQRECPSPKNQRGGVHSPAVEVLGESQFLRLEKSLALCLLCGIYPHTICSNLSTGVSLAILNIFHIATLVIHSLSMAALHLPVIHCCCLTSIGQPRPASRCQNALGQLVIRLTG